MRADFFRKYWTTRPGPHVYYSTFWTISASTCWKFQTAEFSSVVLFNRWHGHVYNISRMVHLTTCGLTGLITFVCHVIASKSDTATIDFLSLSQGCIGLAYYWFIVLRRTQYQAEETSPIDLSHLPGPLSKLGRFMTSTNEVKQVPSKRRLRRTCASRALTSLNILLLVIHACVLVLFTCGSVQLALLYRYRIP